MELNYNNSRIRVTFLYNSGAAWGKAALRNIKNKRILTYCQIAQKRDGGDWVGLSCSYAARDRRDPFTKGAGRRAALQGATNQLTDRNLRKAIWEAYFDMHSDSVELWVPSPKEPALTK